jgi:YD repeat-containing protein
VAEDASLRRGALSRRELAGAAAAPLGLGRASGARGSRELARRWLARRAEADRQLLRWSRLEGLAAGDRVRVTWPDGFYAGYVYDAMNRIAAVNENGATSGVGVLASYGYDNLGRRVSLSRGNGTTTSSGYDGADRLSSLAEAMPASASSAQSWGFSFNPASQLIGRTSTNTAYIWGAYPLAGVSSAYDGLNRDASIAAVSPASCPTPASPF